MKTNKIIFFLFLLLIIGFLTFRISYSYFSDSGSSTDNILAASATFPSATPTPTLPITPTPTVEVNHLVINEVGIHGSANNEWVEIYNPTGSSVTLNGWKISDALETDTLPIATISAHGFGVIIGKNGSASIPGSAVTIKLTGSDIGSGLLDSGDAVYLKNSSDTIVDSMSYGANTSVFPTPPDEPANDTETLIRHPNGIDTDSASDWIITITTSLGTSNP